MKVFQNISHPIKLKKRNTESESINLFNFRNVFYIGETNVESLDIDSTSSAIFLEEIPSRLENIIVESGKLLLTEKDTLITGDVTIQNGGELRII